MPTPTFSRHQLFKALRAGRCGIIMQHQFEQLSVLDEEVARARVKRFPQLVLDPAFKADPLMSETAYRFRCRLGLAKYPRAPTSTITPKEPLWRRKRSRR